jgi:hypothetical protein
MTLTAGVFVVLLSSLLPPQAANAVQMQTSASSESDYLRKLFHDVFLLFDLMTVL